MFTWSNAAGRLLERTFASAGDANSSTWAGAPRTPAVASEPNPSRRRLFQALAAEAPDLLDLAVLDRDFEAIVADLESGKLRTYGEVTNVLLARARERLSTKRTPSATPSPWVWAHVTPGRTQGAGIVHAGSLTPAAARRLVEEARAHGAGAALEITIMAPSREARIDEVRRQLEPLCGSDVHLRVRAYDESPAAPTPRSRSARPAPPRFRQRLAGAFAGGLR